MLKQRIVTAVVLVPLVLGAVLFAPPQLFAALVAVALTLLALEFAALCRLDGMYRALFAMTSLALFACAVMPWRYVSIAGQTLLAITVLFWLLAPLWLLTRTALPGAVKILSGLPLIAGAGFALHALKLNDTGGLWVLCAFVVVWAADIGGYAAGRLWGRRKLAPSISPGKTWEGFAGGLALVFAAGAGIALVVLELRSWIAWTTLFALLAVLSIFSVVGDLLESLLKRQAGVKDSGTLLPGHGGVLDRLDSLLAVAPLLLFAGLKIGIFGELSFDGL